MNSPIRAKGLAEASSLLSEPYAAEDIGLADCPLFVIELPVANLDAEAHQTHVNHAELAKLIAAVPAVVVGVVADDIEGAAAASDLAQICEACDIVLAPDHLGLAGSVPVSDITELAAAIAQSPLAATTLMQLLRLSKGLSTVDGLVAESLAYATLQSGSQFRAWLAAQPSKPQPQNDAPPVLVKHQASTLHITLNRPERHNAFSAAMRDNLLEVLRAAWVDPSLDGIVIGGSGSTFCSGGDLSEFGTTPNSGTAHQIRSVRSAAFWIDRLAAKTRVIMQGSCVGAGVELAAYAHDVVAHPDTTFCLPEVAMGLIPGAGGTVSIARRIGRQRLGYMALTGTKLNTTTALSWGLIDRIER